MFKNSCCTYSQMAPKRRLSYVDRVKIVVLRDEGYSLAAIASKVRCSHSSISRTLLRVKETGTFKDRKRSSRPQISGLRKDQALARISVQNRRLNISHLKRGWLDNSEVISSTRTVRRRHVTGLYGRVARKKTLLTERHKRIRLT